MSKWSHDLTKNGDYAIGEWGVIFMYTLPLVMAGIDKGKMQSILAHSIKNNSNKIAAFTHVRYYGGSIDKMNKDWLHRIYKIMGARIVFEEVAYNY
jgi:hypothetical protein